jgi:hypothetical protein
MNSKIQTYRNPIIVTILIVAGIGLWAWQQWHFELEYYHDRVRHHASGVFDTLEGTIQGLNQAGPLHRSQIEGILKNVIRQSALRFVVLEHDGKRTLQAGSAPGTLPLNSTEGNLFVGRDFLLWKTIHLQPEVQNHPGKTGYMSELKIEAGDLVMILGFEIPIESRMLSAARQSIILIPLRFQDGTNPRPVGQLPGC